MGAEPTNVQENIGIAEKIRKMTIEKEECEEIIRNDGYTLEMKCLGIFVEEPEGNSLGFFEKTIFI